MVASDLKEAGARNLLRLRRARVASSVDANLKRSVLRQALPQCGNVRSWMTSLTWFYNWRKIITKNLKQKLSRLRQGCKAESPPACDWLATDPTPRRRASYVISGPEYASRDVGVFVRGAR